MTTPLRIAIQKDGRLKTRSLEVLSSLGYEFDLTDDRSLLNRSRCGLAEVILVRNRDIPLFVASAAADLGIVGQNVVLEAGFALPVLMELEFARCRLDIAVPVDSAIQDIDDLAGKRIATSYRIGLKQFLEREDVPANIVELSGSVEVAPSVGLADAICDLVDSGRTLKEHGLRSLCTVYTSQAVLIASPSLKHRISKALPRLPARTPEYASALTF